MMNSSDNLTLRKAAMLAVLVVSFLCLSSCGGNTATLQPGQMFQFDFANGAQGWSSGFSNYPAGQEVFFELASGIKTLPIPLDQTKTGFFISGSNHSAALFMFLKKQITGLKPNTVYSVSFHVEFATNVPAGCAGIGGPPGEAVFVKAGSTATEPLPILSGGSFVINIDSGIGATGGKDALVIGNVANSSNDCAHNVYETKMLDSASALTVRTDATGSLWLLVGTASGFEGVTSLYYRQFRATFTVPQ